MKIEAVAAEFPSKRVTNDEVLDLIRQHSRDQFQGDVDSTLRRIGKFLRVSGASERRWLAACRR